MLPDVDLFLSLIGWIKIYFYCNNKVLKNDTEN